MLDGFGGGVMITIVILSLLALTIVIGWVVARRRRASRVRDDIPLFSVPATGQSKVLRPHGAPGARAQSSSSEAPSRATNRDPRHASPAPTIRTRDGAVSTLSRAQRNELPVAAADDEVGEAVDGASVRYWRAADGTLQFLPGRLEIAAGRDAGQEIRFVRTSGPDGTCITFGRAEGAPYRHVQLREPTVSRSHARMALETPTTPSGMPTGATGSNGARWRLENLSSTNPVVVNGRALDSRGGASASVILSDGDRIEMGEVAFVFHAR
jgi:FHA domain-containing protein